MNKRQSLLPFWSLALVVLVTLLILFGIIALLRSPTVPAAPLPQASTSTGSPIPYPSNYPAPKQTLEQEERETLQAALLTPSPEPGMVFVPSFPTLSPEEMTPYIPQGTPAGDGIITDDVGRPPISGSVFLLVNSWYKESAGKYVIVYAGMDGRDYSQGVIIVARSGTSSYPEGDWYDTPIKDGGVEIRGVEGERLILTTESGTTLYFDVPGQSFVSSLSEIVPTITPGPTFTPSPTFEPLYSDDAPDKPGYVFENSPLNTDLHYYINPSSDVDWFRFHPDSAGRLVISLTDLPANYTLVVVDISNRQTTTATESGLNDKFVTLTDAPVGDYFVKIAGLDGAYDANMPYTLRFNAPLPATDTPTPTPTSQLLTTTFYLHGSGTTANPPTLFLDSTAPTDTTTKYKDSASVNFSGGNAWKEIGTWTAAPELTAGQLMSLSDLRVWLGLKNSDDIGTRFDLRAEVYRNGELVTAGESDCITGVTRNANQAKEVPIAFAAFAPVSFDGAADGLTLKIMTRIGTDGAGAFCGRHSNAVGVRVYFDAVNRLAKLEAP